MDKLAINYTVSTLTLLVVYISWLIYIIILDQLRLRHVSTYRGPKANQVIRTRLENGLDAGRIRGKIRVIPRYSAAEPGAESAELRFRAFRAARN